MPLSPEHMGLFHSMVEVDEKNRLLRDIEYLKKRISPSIYYINNLDNHVEKSIFSRLLIERGYILNPPDEKHDDFMFFTLNNGKEIEKNILGTPNTGNDYRCEIEVKIELVQNNDPIHVVGYKNYDKYPHPMQRSHENIICKQIVKMFDMDCFKLLDHASINHKENTQPSLLDCLDLAESNGIKVNNILLHPCQFQNIRQKTYFSCETKRDALMGGCFGDILYKNNLIKVYLYENRMPKDSIYLLEEPSRLGCWLFLHSVMSSITNKIPDYLTSSHSWSIPMGIRENASLHIKIGE